MSRGLEEMESAMVGAAAISGNLSGTDAEARTGCRDRSSTKPWASLQGHGDR